MSGFLEFLSRSGGTGDGGYVNLSQFVNGGKRKGCQLYGGGEASRVGNVPGLLYPVLERIRESVNEVSGIGLEPEVVGKVNYGAFVSGREGGHGVL